MRLLLNSFLYGLSSIANAAIPFILLPLLTKLLSREELGIVSLWESIFLAALPVVCFGINGAINVEFFRKSHSEFQEYVASAIAIPAACALLLLPIAVPIAIFTSASLDIPTGWILGVIPLALFGSYRLSLLAIWQARGSAAKFGIFQLLTSILNLGASYMLVKHFDFGWQGRGLGIAAGFGISGIAAILILASQSMVFRKPRMEYIRSAFQIGAPLVPHAIAMMVILFVDRFFLSTFHDLATVGIYVVAFQISAAITVLGNAMNQAWTPQIFKFLSENSKSGDSATVRISLVFIAALFGAFVVLILSIPAIFRWLIGPEFQEAAGLVPALAASFLLAAAYKPFVNVIFFERQTKLLMYIALITTSASVFANLILVPSFGAQGAVAASLIANFCLTACTVIAAQRVRSLPWLRPGSAD